MNINMKIQTLFIAIFLFSCLPKTTYSQDYQSFLQNQKSQDIERAHYWKKKGYTFDPEYMSAFMMDERVREIERRKSKSSKREKYNFVQNHSTIYSKHSPRKQNTNNPLPIKNNTTQYFTQSYSGTKKPVIKNTYIPRKPKKTVSHYNQKKNTSFDSIYDKDIASKPNKHTENKNDKNIWILIVLGIAIFFWWINKSFPSSSSSSSSSSDQASKTKIDPVPIDVFEEIIPKEPCKNEKPITIILKENEMFCKQNGLNALYHMTNVSNLPNIFQYGILNNYESRKKNLVITDISDPKVQRWRDREESCFHRPIHEYAPLYINPQNPMLFVRKNIQHELCILEISCAVLDEQEFVFTDGNAASRETRFYKSLNDLNKIPWEVLKNDRWDYFDDGKRKRCAEFLVFPAVDVKYIRCLHFLNNAIANKYCKSGYLCKSTPSLFF